MKISGIYVIRNVINNKVYIGSAVDLNNRWFSHRNNSKKGKKHSTEAKEKMSLSHKGKKISEETKEKIRLTMLNKKK